MRKIISLTLIIIALAASLHTVCAASNDETGDTWVEKTQMPTARGYLGVAVVNGKIYAIGGSGPTGTNEEYDPATDTWTTKASMPDPQESFSERGCAIVACQGKIYCIGGWSTGVSGANKVYDPTIDSWQTKVSMPTARYGLQAQVVDDKIYLIGGRRYLGYTLGSENLNVTEIYNPATNTWSTGSSMPNLEGYVSAVVDGKICVIGQTTQIYNPKTDSWSVGAAPPKKIGSSAAAAATTGTMAPKRIYVYDGSILQIYDPQTNNWTNGTAPPTSREGIGIGVVDDKLYFIGGLNWPWGFGFHWMLFSTNEQYTPIDYGTLQAASFPTIPIVVLGISITLATVGAAIYFKRRKAKC